MTQAPRLAIDQPKAAIVAIDLWSVEREYWMFSPPASVLYASDPAIELLKKQSEPGRVVVYSQGDSGIASADPYYGTRTEPGATVTVMLEGVIHGTSAVTEPVSVDVPLLSCLSTKPPRTSDQWPSRCPSTWNSYVEVMAALLQPT